MKLEGKKRMIDFSILWGHFLALIFFFFFSEQSIWRWKGDEFICQLPSCLSQKLTPWGINCLIYVGAEEACVKTEVLGQNLEAGHERCGVWAQRRAAGSLPCIKTACVLCPIINIKSSDVPGLVPAHLSDFILHHSLPPPLHSGHTGFLSVPSFQDFALAVPSAQRALLPDLCWLVLLKSSLNPV